MQRPLHSLERRFLKALEKAGNVSLEEAASTAGIARDQARRTVEWLKSKGLVEVSVAERQRISLASEGLKAVKEGFPERRLVEAFQGKTKTSLARLKEKFAGDQQEFSAALGYAKEKGWIEVGKHQGGTTVQLRTDKAVTGALSGEMAEKEELLRLLSQGEHYYDELSADMKKDFNELSKRAGYLSKKPIKEMTVHITPKGKSEVKGLGDAKEVEAVTPEMLASGAWKTVNLRPLDVEAPAPVVHPGKKHPVQRFVDEVREIFVSLGFQEIDGPIVQPSFWNFDALFIPQDHSARDMQDTFYLLGLSADKVEDGVVAAVSGVHEYGGSTGSKGWGYKWSMDEARRLVLRTHTTAVTVKYLADFKPSEARVFSIGRVFRNEKVTFKNLLEFHQIEGITVGSNVTLRDMMGLLSKFYHRLGLEKVKFWPSFFPYTEPSLQSVVYMEKIGKWVELCGMGIFRPEVTLPMGVSNPVLAWGGGLERLIMLRYGVDDARWLYENNLKWLRDTPVCLS